MKKNPLPQSPSGFFGKLFGKIMELTNSRAYRGALDALNPIEGEIFLEIGFGTGLFSELLLKSRGTIVVHGIDPTPTMVDVATKRLQKKRLDSRANLRVGYDSDLPDVSSFYSGIVAIHSFQFWKEPEKTIKNIFNILKPNGRFILVFRNHSQNPPDWLPNPISRSGKEVELALKLLVDHGFSCTFFPDAGSSKILRAVRTT